MNLFTITLFSRKEAIELVKMYDGKCAKEYIQKFCDYVGILEKEFWNTTEKFRGPMWKKNEEGKWHNTFLDLLK